MLGAWVAGGRDVASFGRQTPASFAAICRAERRRHQLDVEERIALQHMAAEMNALASVGKLEELDKYLSRARPPERRDVAGMIATMQDAAARSGAIRIRMVEEE